MHASVLNSSLGYISIIEEDGFVTAILFSFIEENPSQITEKAKKQIEEYLDRKRTTFDLPFKLFGTDFQKRVWEVISCVPYGETISYREIGERINSRGYQAIGSACGKNPLPILIPCHRILGKDNLGGFGAGLEIKQRLLKIEGFDISKYSK